MPLNMIENNGRKNYIGTSGIGVRIGEDNCKNMFVSLFKYDSILFYQLVGGT